MMDEGKLRRADPWRAALHRKGLIECDLLDRRMRGVIEEPDPHEMEQTATAAAEAFLMLYGVTE